MAEIFHPESLTIKEMFGNANSMFQIPNYQRKYSWKDEQLDQLWTDITEMYEESLGNKSDNSNYFLGSVILVKPKENESYYDVVDGQQRLTTLTILFCVLKSIYPDINKNVDLEKAPSAIKISKLNKCIKDEDDRKRLRFKTQEGDMTDFETLIIEQKDFTSYIKPTKAEIESGPYHRFINAAVFFRDELIKLKEPAVAKLLNYLFNQVFLIRIDCSSRHFAIKLFQVLNDRGLDLTSADLIKSYLMSKLEEDKHNQFILCWNAIETLQSDLEEDKLDDLFTYYLFYETETNPKKSLSEELEIVFNKKLSAGIDSNKIINDFKKFVETYKNDVYSVTDPISNSLWYIKWNSYFKSILMTALHSKYREFEKLKFELRRFYYLNWISGATLTNIKQTSFNLIAWIKANISIQEIRTRLNTKMKKDGVFEEVLKNISSEKVYGQVWLKPLLLTIEYSEWESDTCPFYELKQRNIQIEHVLPQKYYVNNDWKHFNEKLAGTYLNSFGNLTLLSASKNPEAGKESFSVKVPVYEGQGRQHAKKEGVTSFLITQKIVNDFHSNRYNKKWNEQAIKDRYNWYCQTIEKLFDIDTTSILKK